MADVRKKAAKQLTEITECPICMSEFSDPRILPCIHTFCFECLKRTGEEAQMKPGDKMPCPLCRKDFIIPEDGMSGIQKNFFMEKFLDFKTTLMYGSDTIIYCDTCNFTGDGKTEITSQFEDYAVVVGLDDGLTITTDVIKINLRQPTEIPTKEQIPTTMQMDVAAAVYRNKMYVIGVGDNFDEIWKYSFVSGWVKCASLVQGRHGHSAAFVDDILYICGGFVNSTKSVLDSVEAYNAITDECTAVGELVYCVKSSGNCVPFKSSLYIFGGRDKDNKVFNCVQVYNTKTNTCSILSKPMPWGCNLIRAVLWETSVILVGYYTCFIFNFETESWQERNQFKTDVVHFGLLLENGRVFVIGGGSSETDKDGKVTWTCRDDIRYIPVQDIIDDKPIEWKIYGRLPKPAAVHAYAKLRC